MATTRQARLTLTEIISAASDTLKHAGYTRVDDANLKDWPANSRAFEDAYAIVALFVYETWQDLNGAWPDAQACLVDLISKTLTRAEPKAWEGYLVLLTAALPDTTAYGRRSEIRYDTSRVRKLVATGAELRTISDVERALLPLLPVSSPTTTTVEQSVLQLLPSLLAGQKIEEGATRAVVDAFLEQEPVMDKLHAYRLRS